MDQVTLAAEGGDVAAVQLAIKDRGGTLGVAEDGIVLDVQVLGIGLKKRHGVGNPRMRKPSARGPRHPRVEIAQDDRPLRTDPSADEDGQIARARRDIQKP